MMNQRTFEQLTDTIEGRATAAVAAQMATRLASDPDIQAVADWLTQFQTWRGQIQLPKPSTHVVEQLVARHAAKFAPQPQPSLWQQLTAVLSFDSGQQLGLLGARSADADDSSRQLAFSTAALDLVLDIERTPQQQTIRGQLLPKHADAEQMFVVQLVHQDADVGMTHTDRLGEFELINTAPGDVQIILSNDALEVWLPPLNLNV